MPNRRTVLPAPKMDRKTPWRAWPTLLPQEARMSSTIYNFNCKLLKNRNYDPFDLTSHNNCKNNALATFRSSTSHIKLTHQAVKGIMTRLSFVIKVLCQN